MNRISNKIINEAGLIVFKVGSSLIVGPDGDIRTDWIDSLGEDIKDCQLAGKKAAVVSSGAIAIGRKVLGLKGALNLIQKQACAAVGQIKLCEVYRQILKFKKIKSAQVLLTSQNAEDESTYKNAVNTLSALLAMDVVPIINENDTVATEEIKFGDNDNLSAIVAQMLGADVLVLLSDIDGLYTADPKANKKAKLVPLVKEITPQIEAMASATKSALGTGGMQSKLAAAKMCLAGGCNMVITTGSKLYPLRRLKNGDTCTWFTAK